MRFMKWFWRTKSKQQIAIYKSVLLAQTHRSIFTFQRTKSQRIVEWYPQTPENGELIDHDWRWFDSPMIQCYSIFHIFSIILSYNHFGTAETARMTFLMTHLFRRNTRGMHKHLQVFRRSAANRVVIGGPAVLRLKCGWAVQHCRSQVPAFAKHPRTIWRFKLILPVLDMSRVIGHGKGPIGCGYLNCRSTNGLRNQVWFEAQSSYQLPTKN